MYNPDKNSEARTEMYSKFPVVSDPKLNASLEDRGFNKWGKIQP